MPQPTSDRYLLDPPVTINEKSLSACSVTSLNDQIYLAWTGTNRRPNILISDDGHRFHSKKTFRRRSSVSVRR